MQYPKIAPQIKNETELFHDGAVSFPFSILDFWRWSVSDLVSNATRGILAEFIVATALEIPLNSIRDEWAAWDLTTNDGIKVEVKSAAYIQSWDQKYLSKISFDIKKKRLLDPVDKNQDNSPRRHADVYVFALLAHQDQTTIDPMDVSQWQFYVVSTKVLDARERSQYSITLPSLEKLSSPLPYSAIKTAVEKSIC